MARQEIEKAVEGLSADQLRQLREHLDWVINSRPAEEDSAPPAGDSGRSQAAPAPQADGSDRRGEQRFSVCIPGSARPLLSARNSIERSFPINIIDLSRNGMRFMVDASAPLYPLAEVSFTGPTGRIRNVTVKLVRMRMIFHANDAAVGRQQCEIAAQTVSEAEMAVAQERQCRIRAANRSVRSPEDLPVLLTAGTAEQLKGYQTLLQSHGHPVSAITEMKRLASALQPQTQCVLYVNGREALLAGDHLAEFREKHPQVAQLAVIESADDRRELMAAGMDECVHAINADALLSMYIERSVKAKSLREPADEATEATQVLIAVENNLALAQIGMACHNERFRVMFSYDVDGMLGILRCGEVNALTIDDHQAAANGWKLLERIRLEFPHLAVVVAVTDLRRGPEALVHGATEYLTQPASKATLTQLVVSARRVAEFEASRQSEAAAAG